MAGNAIEYIKIDGKPYAVFEGGIRYDDATYSPTQRQYVTPDVEDVSPVDKYFQSDWSGGGGFFRVGSDDPQPVYSKTSNIDPSFPKRFFLSPKQNTSLTTAGAALGVTITHMIMYKNSVFAFGGTKGFFWNTTTYATPAANSRQIWVTTGPSGATTFPGTVTGVAVYNGYLIVACGTGQFVQYTSTATPTLAADWAPTAGTNDKMQFLTVLNGVLYGARSATGAYTTAAVYASTDITAGFATLSGTVSDSAADVTFLSSYNNNLVAMKTDGIYLFDTIGASFSAIQGLRNYIATTNGLFATEHYGSLFFKIRESLGEWTGNSLLGLSATRGISFQGNDSQLENEATTRGSPQAILSVPPFLYVTVYTGSGYIIKKFDARFGTPDYGYHDWIDLGNNASSVLYYWPGASSNPFMFASKGTDLIYWVMPRYTHLPTQDSNCEFAATGDHYSSRINIGSLQYSKACIDLIYWVEGLTGNSFTTTIASSDDFTTFIDPTGTGANVFTTDSTTGFRRVTFRTGANTTVGREFIIKTSLTSGAGTSSPIVYLVGLRVRIQYPFQRQWLITIPGKSPMDSHINKTPRLIETDLRTSRLKSNSIEFVDHFNETFTVDFIRLARQGGGKKTSGDLINSQSDVYFEVQLVEWQDIETT